MKDFLNEVLAKEQRKITNLTYLTKEELRATEIDRKCIFDLYCENENGEKFIVELQKPEQKNFKINTLFHSTFPIERFQRLPVYIVSLLDFVFDQEENRPDVFRYDMKFADEETKRFFNKMPAYIYLAIPKFNKSVAQLQTNFEKWMYLLKNLNLLENIPEKFNEKIFTQLFETAEIAKFTPEMLSLYEDSLEFYQEKNAIKAAKKQGYAQGKQEERRSIAKNMLEKGMPQDLIQQITGLSAEQIQKLK